MDRRQARRARSIERHRAIVRRYLRFLSRFKVSRCFGQEIGITGSLGKSSAKLATVQVLESKFSVFPTHGEYNNDIGLLCTLFRQEAGFASRTRWRRALIGATWNVLTDHERYDKLVLEMAVGRPGGMAASLRIFRPEICVFTGVAAGHFGEGRFSDEEGIFQEKALLIRTMEGGTAILNRDDPYCRRLGGEDLKADVLWYGRLPGDRPVDTLPAGLYFDQLGSSTEGITAELHLSSPGDGRLPGASRHRLSCPILGEHHIYVLLPALLTGLVTGIDLEMGCRVLADYALPPGRMTRIAGVNSSTILDATWNATPRSVEAALETLRAFPAKRRIAVLGSILGQGDRTESVQREVGGIVSRYADLLITVGSEARLMAEEATARGMSEALVVSFGTAEEAGRHLKESVRPGDVVLLKASQSLCLNHAIRYFMKDPDEADRLLDAR